VSRQDDPISPSARSPQLDVLLASGGRDRSIRLWCIGPRGGSSSFGGPLLGHRGTVTCVTLATCAASLMVVSGSHDRTVRVWDLASRHLVCEPLGGHGGKVTSVACCSHQVGLVPGVIVVSACDDKRLRVWAVVSGVASPLCVLAGHGGPVASVALLAESLRLPQHPDAPPPPTSSGQVDGPEAVTGSQGGESHADGTLLLVSGSWDRTVRVWGLCVAMTSGSAGEPFGSCGGSSLTLADWSTGRGALLWASRAEHQVLDARGVVLDGTLGLAPHQRGLLAYYGADMCTA
jgi:WD40 repeat protein